MSGVPYTFATATSPIPLGWLDTNFATQLTIGTTSIGLGNTVTSIANVTLTTPTLGTPVSGNLTNCTAIPVANATGTLLVANGGTGQTNYTNGQLLIGNTTSSGLDKATLTAGSGISITNSAGGISIAATGVGTVTSVNVLGGTTGLTFSGGPITSSGNITVAGTLAVANGGTGQTAYTNGQLLIGNTTSGGLDKATITAGSGISVTNSAGGITIAASGLGAGTVTSVDALGGTTGMSFTGGPITSAGNLTLTGTLVTANGGTGLTSFTANGAVYASNASTLTTGTLPVASGGTGVTTSTGTGSVVLSASPTFTGTISAATISATGNVSGGNLSATTAVSDAIGNVRDIIQNAQTTGYTLQASDDGKHISITTGGVTVPSSVFSAGQTASIYNNSASNQTITQGSGVTMYLVGTATTGNRTLAQRGLATVLCVAANTFVITGGGIT